MYEYGENITDKQLEVLASACLSPQTAVQFRAFMKQVKNRYTISKLFTGEMKWPDKPEERDLLYFMAQSFRAQLIKELPQNNQNMTSNQKQMAIRAKELLKELSSLSLEIAQMVMSKAKGETIPSWFMMEVIRDLPRLVAKRDQK
jgi:HPt (histidine-containing phosphotransfer) domain-containing protein